MLTDYVLNHVPIPDGMRILQLPPEFSGLTVITPQLVADATKAGYPIWIWPNNRDLENLASYRDVPRPGHRRTEHQLPGAGRAGRAGVRRRVGSPGKRVAGVWRGRRDARPGTYPSTLSAAGLDGTYTSYLPPAYDGATPLPLVILLHGYTQTAALVATQSDMPAHGERDRFVTVAPQITRSVTLWDNSFDGADVTWIGALLEEVEATRCVDTNRVYVAGMSHGAMMASTLACVMSDRIAAIAPVAGVRHPEDCAPTRPVPIITFHGTDDPYIDYEGGPGPKALELPAPDGKGTFGDAIAADPTLMEIADEAAIPDRVAAWAEQNGCTAGDTLADIGDVTPQQWACPDGGDVMFYTVHGGGHSWPGSAFDANIAQIVGPTTTSIDATALMVSFFAQHPLGGSE